MSFTFSYLGFFIGPFTSRSLFIRCCFFRYPSFFLPCMLACNRFVFVQILLLSIWFVIHVCKHIQLVFTSRKICWLLSIGALPLFRILGLPKFRIFPYQSKTTLSGSRQGETCHNLIYYIPKSILSNERFWPDSSKNFIILIKKN